MARVHARYVDTGHTLRAISGFRKNFVDKHLGLLVASRTGAYNFRMSTDLQEIVSRIRRIRHDANNPLTAALGHVQLLLDDPAITDEEARDSLRIIESELRRITDILRQLNDIKAE